MIKKMVEILKDLSVKKAKQENDIPIKLIKKNIDLFAFVLSRIFNFNIDKTSFPNSLKQAGISPVHKKDDTNDKNNYRPVSILPSLSKAFEKCQTKGSGGILEKAAVLIIQILE